MQRNTLSVLLFGILVLGLSHGGALGQSANLRFRWDPTAERRYSLLETMDQTISGEDLRSELRWERSITFIDRVVSVSDSEARVERSFLTLEIKVTRDAQAPIRYDSTNPDPKNATHPLIAPFAALPGSSIAFTVQTAGPESGKVSDVTGAKEALDAMLGPLSGGALAQGLNAFTQRPDPRSMIVRQLEQSLGVIPGKPTRVGERWPVEIEHVSPLAGRLSSDLTATLSGLKRSSNLATIEISGTLTLTQQDEPGLAGLLGIVLESGVMKGRIGFDEERGLIVGSTVDLETSWSIAKNLTGSDAPMTQTIRQSSILTLDP